MFKKNLVCAVAFSAAIGASAQDSTSANPLNISGFVDVYYRYDFAKTAANTRTAFNSSYNSFGLGMASVKLDKTLGKVGFVADLGFGQRAKEFSYNDNGITAAVKQLYMTYSPTENLKLTAGSWATHVGYELVDAPGNRNYSMSYMFTYGPYFHTGVKAEYSFGKSGVMVGLANPTDFKLTDNPPRMFLGQFYTGTKNDKLKAYLNYVGGKSTDSTRGGQFDLVVLGTVTDKFSVGFNGTVASSTAKVRGKFADASAWWGSAVYLNLDPSPKFGITLRSELFSDEKMLLPLAGLGGGTVFANTLSGNVHLGAITVIPELRLDNGSKKVFFDKDGGSTKSAFSALVAAVYKF
ncbi:MAG: porin [Bacteroidetes bacterium]|nr:MAG: porin [Bacteroidota bacterium]